MKSVNLCRAGAILLVFLAAQPKAFAQSLLAYISAPDVQSSSQAGNTGAETETFNSLPLGNQSTPYVSAIGTYQFSSTAQGAILAADQFGGANGSQYMSFGAQSGTSAPITITLNGNYNYFGFWFSAGDANNRTLSRYCPRPRSRPSMEPSTPAALTLVIPTEPVRIPPSPSLMSRLSPRAEPLIRSSSIIPAQRAPASNRTMRRSMTV